MSSADARRGEHEQSSIRGRDVLAMPAGLLGALPLRASALLAVSGLDARIVVTTSEAVWRAASSLSGVVAFGPNELDALVRAVENERASHRELVAWCRAKLQTPSWRLDLAIGLGALVDVRPPLGWPFGTVLRALGAELVSVAGGNALPIGVTS